MNKVYDKTEFLKYMNKRAKELYSSSELNYWDCYYALQTMNRCIAEILENGDSINIYKYWDIKPKLFKSVKRYSPLLNMEYEVPERYYPSLSKMEKKFILALDAMKPELKSLKKLIINGTKKKQ